MVPNTVDLNGTGVGRLSREEMRTLINIEEPFGTPVLSGQAEKDEPEKRRNGGRQRRKK